ncbi:purine-cytosine permease Fcy2p [Monosporozyma servazzii]
MSYEQYNSDNNVYEMKSSSHQTDIERSDVSFDKKIPSPDTYSISSQNDYIVESSEETKLNFFNRLAVSLNAETKGIEPVMEDEKEDGESIVSASSMWFSVNMVIAAYALGGLGPMIYKLNFGTSVLVIVFFNILGAMSIAFFSIFGSQLGLRQMVLSRYLLGNVTSRIFAIINVIACVGWGIVNTVVSAQLLNMVNQGGPNLPLWAGCLVIVGCTVAVTFFGYNLIHTYEKYSWIPNFAVFLVIIARLKMSGNFSTGEWTSGPTTAGSVLSFGSAVYGFATGYTTYASDYTVYMPKNVNKFKVFFSVSAGLLLPLFFCMILGAASAMGAVNDPTWNEYYQKNSMGGLTYAILVPNSLHGFGEFCCVLLAMSTIANNIPNMYSIALSMQAIYAPFAKVPRVIWTMCGNASVLAIGIPACYYFDSFMENFMNSIGYYLAIYSAIAVTEHFVFRKGFKGYNVEDYDNWDKLPIGIAGTSALIVGAFGVALGMDQTYWVGEIGRLIGENGGDIGFELGASWSFIVFILVRPLEIKYFGR